MRLFIAILFLLGCTQKPNLVINSRDTSLTILPIVDNRKCDSLKHLADSFRVKLFLANDRVEEIKVYMKIVKKNSTQYKFLQGWVARAVK